MQARELVVALQGFGPFATFRENPSQQIVEDLLKNPPWTGLRLVGKVLPVTQAGVGEIPALVRNWEPDVWIGVGLAAGRARVSVERIAVNLSHYEQPDEDGAVVHDAEVVEGGPAAYRSSLPDRTIAAAWAAADIPGQVSYSAGTFLCNQAFYLARHTVDATGRDVRTGFVHIPATVGMGRRTDPALPYGVVRQAVILAVEETVRAIHA